MKRKCLNQFQLKMASKLTYHNRTFSMNIYATELLFQNVSMLDRIFDNRVNERM